MTEFAPEAPFEAEKESWQKLTSAQKRVAKAIAFITGPGKFDRPTLAEQARKSNTISEIVDDKERLLTSLSYTNLLNTLTEKGYLRKISQGGQNPVVFDTQAVEQQSVQSAPFGATEELVRLAETVLEREGLTTSLLEDIDSRNVNEVVSAVNNAIGQRVLAITADSSKYGINISTCRTIVDNTTSTIDVPFIETELFHKYKTVDYSIPNFDMEATIESITEGVINLVITHENKYIDEAYIREGNTAEQFEINDTFDIIYLSDDLVYLVINRARSNEVKEEVQQILEEFREQVIPAEEWEE
jgi:hypothetical protein